MRIFLDYILVIKLILPILSTTLLWCRFFLFCTWSNAHTKLDELHILKVKGGIDMNHNYMNVQNYYNPIQKDMMTDYNNNNNFNKCTYVQQVEPNQLYDAYAGFIRGNMYPDLYNQYKVSKPFEIEPMNEQAQMLTYVDAYCFGAHDINLYLDTHPNDQAMIELYNRYREESENALKQYESRFGPITVDSDATSGYPWAWNNSPWPWENR